MTTEYEMISDFRNQMEHRELERKAVSNIWEHRIMRACAMAIAALVILKTLGVL
jgi:hypothetical protein